jgi:hypothetical protein
MAIPSFSAFLDVIYSSNAVGVTQNVSSACETFWGLKPSDMIGRSVFDLERDGIYQPSVTRMVLESRQQIAIHSGNEDRPETGGHRDSDQKSREQDHKPASKTECRINWSTQAKRSPGTFSSVCRQNSRIEIQQ